MNIMVLSQKLLTSDVTGMSKRLKLFLKYFKDKGHKVTFVSFYENDNEIKGLVQTNEYYDKIITVKLCRKLAYIRMLKAFFTGKPFKLEFLDTLKMHKVIDKELQNAQYDTIYSFTYKMVPFMEKHNQYKRFVDFVDSFALNYDRQIESATKWYKKLFLKSERKRIYKYEKHCIDKFDKCFYISKIDKDYMTDESHLGKTAELPIVIDTEYFKNEFYEQYNTNEIVYLGLMSYIANHDAVMHFIHNIFPLIKKQIPNAVFKVVGANPREELLEYARQNNSVIVTGMVDDVRKHIQTSAVSVTPIRIASGIQTKTLEEMSMGIPVVTSEVGANPITTDRSILPVAKTEQEYADKICEIMQNRDLRLELSQKSRQFVIDNFSKEKFIKKIEKVFDISECNQYEIISLGLDCAVRRYLTMGGLKKTKAQGELSMPFDLSYNPTKSLIKILKNNFDDYFNNLAFRKGRWINKKYRIAFNHDKDCGSDAKIKLISRFAKRIENFNNIMNTNNCIYFILKSTSGKSEIVELYKLLKKKRKNLPFKLIVLDMEEKIKKGMKNNNIVIFSKHHPFPKCNDWWRPEYINSEASIKYQKQICDFVESEISKDFKVNKYNKEDVNQENGEY